MRSPPLLPSETLARVLRVAKFDGTTVFVLSGLFAVMTASGGEMRFAVIGLLAAGAGAIELHGAGLLGHGDRRGINWLIASQPVLLAIIYIYCALRMSQFDIPPIPESRQVEFDQAASQLGMSTEELQRVVYRFTIQTVAVVATLFQGWMLIYYLRRRRAVVQAADEMPVASEQE